MRRFLRARPHFPRRVVLTETSIALVGVLVLTVSTVASLLGGAYALKVDAGRALGVDIDSVCGGRGLCGRCQVVQGLGAFPIDVRKARIALKKALQTGN